MADLHATQRLWQHAVRRAGTAADADAEPPPLPKLKMRDLAWALLHFAELLEGRVPPAERKTWRDEVLAAQWILTAPPDVFRDGGGLLGPVKTTATWPHLARALRQAAHRAVYAPGLCGTAQRTVVGVAFTLFRKTSGSRAEANDAIRRGLERLEAGCWLAAARPRAAAVRAELADARGWWGGAQLALFETKQGAWWLARLVPGRPVELESGTKEDLLACVPDAKFAEAVRTVMAEMLPAAR
ncbi:MAG: hypothetical protein AB1730_00130 [Myxococcota bacterium]|jgi:hypothetical protein